MPDLITVVLAALFLAILGLEIFFHIRDRYGIIVLLLMTSSLISSVYQTMSSNESSESDISSYIRILCLCFCGAYGYYYYLKNRKRLVNGIPNEFRLFIGFIIVAAVSLISSVDAYYSSARIVSLLALFGSMLGLYIWLRNERTHRSLILSMFYFVVCLLLANIIFSLIFKERAWQTIGGSPRFKGLLSHANTFGSFCMVSYPVLFWGYGKIKYFHKMAVSGIILLMMAFHLLSGSRSSIIASMIIGLLWLTVKKKLKIIVVPLFLSLSLMLLFQIRISPLRSFSRGQHSEFSITNISDRNIIWEESIKLIKKRPFLGYGYDITGKIFDSSVALYRNKKLQWLTKKKESFHNGYITIAVGVGLIGLILWLFVILPPALRLFKRTKTDLILVVLSIMLSCLIVNLMEYTINPASAVSSVFFWIAWTLSFRLVRPQNNALRPADSSQRISS